MADWPLTIDGREFHPVPESWLPRGYDDGDGHPRLYGVSAAVSGRDIVHVRYLAPTVPKVLRAEMRGQRTDSGVVPAGTGLRVWPRSLTPDGAPPTDAARSVEIEYLRELWGGRVDTIPGDDDVAVADGGRAVQALGDPLQTHLTESGGGRSD